MGQGYAARGPHAQTGGVTPSLCLLMTSMVMMTFVCIAIKLNKNISIFVLRITDKGADNLFT